MFKSRGANETSKELKTIYWQAFYFWRQANCSLRLGPVKFAFIQSDEQTQFGTFIFDDVNSLMDIRGRADKSTVIAVPHIQQ